MDITADLINEARSAISKVPFKGADQYITERQNVIQKIADANKVRADDLMNATRQETLKRLEKMTKPIDERLEKVFNRSLNLEGKIANIAEAAPMETPYGKSFLSYTPEGKVAGITGKVLRGAAKVAGPAGAALTAGELGGALAELRKLGAEKIAAENEAKQAAYTSEERVKLRNILKKLREEAKLRD